MSIITYSSGATALGLSRIRRELKPGPMMLVQAPDSARSPLTYAVRAVRYYRDEKSRPEPELDFGEADDPARVAAIFFGCTTQFDRLKFAMDAREEGLRAGLLVVADDRIHPMGAHETQTAMANHVPFAIHPANRKTGGHRAFLRQPAYLAGEIAVKLF